MQVRRPPPWCQSMSAWPAHPPPPPLQADAVIVVSEGEAENARALLHHNSLDARAKSLVTFAVAYPVALEPGVKPFVTPAEQAQRTDIVFLGAFRPVSSHASCALAEWREWGRATAPPPPPAADVPRPDGLQRRRRVLLREARPPPRPQEAFAGALAVRHRGSRRAAADHGPRQARERRHGARVRPARWCRCERLGGRASLPPPILRYVDDLASLFSKARIMVVPHTYAAGAAP